jgi:hypothetical protein
VLFEISSEELLLTVTNSADATLLEDTGVESVLAKHNQNDQVKEDEMGRACSTNGGDEECK